MFLSAIVSLSLKIVHTGNIVQTVIPDECSAFVVCPIRNMFTYGFACWRERHIMLRIHFRNRVKRARSTHVEAQESSIRNIWNDVNFLYFDFCRFRGMRQNRSLSKDRGRCSCQAKDELEIHSLIRSLTNVGRGCLAC